MPGAYPPEFRRRAVELARLGEKPVAQIAEDLGISDATLYNWVRRAAFHVGRQGSLTAGGGPVSGVPWNVRRRKRGRVAELGYSFDVAPEIEYFCF